MGGGVAFRALEVEPTLYDRAIMFAPFVEIAGALGNVPNSVLHSGTGITWWWSSGLTPSTDCRDKINAHQSNEGYCSFHFANLAAVRDLGSAAVEDAAKIVTPFQIVGVSPDTSADNERALEIMENSGSFHGHAQACYLKGIPHAFLDALLPRPPLVGWRGEKLGQLAGARHTLSALWRRRSYRTRSSLLRAMKTLRA